MTTASADAASWTPPLSRELSTPDGRVLRYCLYGPEDGRPVIDHHGTPGTRLWPARVVNLAARSGARVLCYDRPGYGGSSRHVNRSIADAADDVARLADAQGWGRFGTCGGSGGGPHALACAVRLADRVTRCAALVCPAPYAADGADGPAGLASGSWFAGMSPGNVTEFTAALSGEPAYRPLVERLGREAMANIEANEPQFLPGYDLPESDLAELRRIFAENSPGRFERARATWLDSADGWVDDVLAMVRPWGVDLAQLGVPVTVWYGPDDVLCPRSHTDWLLAYLPGVQARELPGGHVVPDDSIAEMFAWVSE
ncbi:MAG: alpha/beta fold hydrolase [Micromonosporaceae bacterium]